MSSLENLPNPEQETSQKMQRKRRNPVRSVNNVVAAASTIKSTKQQARNVPLKSTKESSSVSIAIKFPTMNETSSSSTSSPLDDTHNDIIDRILLNSESRQGPQNATIFESESASTSTSKSYTTFKDSTSGKLTVEELNQLSVMSTFDVSVREQVGGSNVDALTNKGNGHDNFNWSSIDVDSVTQLIGLLEDHVKSALSIDLIREAREAHDQEDEEWLEDTCQKTSPHSMTNRSEVLRQGLQAATILLSIMISSNIDRRVFNEDVIESIITLMKIHMVNHIIPSLSCTGHTASYASIDATDDTPSEETPRKKQKVSKKDAKKSIQKDETASAQQSLIPFLKKVYSGISSTVGLLTNLIERLDFLVHAVAVDDQPLLSICASSLSSLTIDPAIGSGSRENASLTQAIQMACVSLVTTIFRKYPKHRIVILEDLFPLYLKIPTSKRSMRTFPVRLFIKASRGTLSAVYGKKSGSGPCRVVTPHGGLRGDGQDFIQVVTVLIFSLIQACVTMPYAKGSSRQDDDDDDDDEMNGSEKDQTDKRLSSGLIECDRTCKIFTTLLIQRCSKKGEEGGASEFRPILSNLVDDLLLVQLLPQFPSAEMLLVEICRKLCEDLVANSAVGNGKKAISSEATYLTTAMDTIGTICSDTAAKISLARENPLVFAKEIDIDALNQGADPSSDSKEVNRCSCGRTTLVDTFMLDCDRCHNWFHGSCVGIAKDKLPDVWICDECTMQIMVVDQMKVFCSKINDKESSSLKSHGKMDLSQEDKAHIMRVLLLNFLTHEEKFSHSAFSCNSRRFHLARFIKDINTDWKSNEGNVFSNVDLIQSHFLDMWNWNGDQAVGGFSQNHQRCEYLSEEGNAKLMLTLNTSKSQLVASLPQLLGVIVALMGDDNNVSLRKLAVKALSQIVQTDSSLMAQRSVREAATKRFSDEAISVREAAVSLVGFYVLQTPEAAKAFHIPLLLRLNDEGISVRKRVIKIFRDLIGLNPSYHERATVLMMLLARASDRKEDDGVRDLIYETFSILWFTTSDDLDGIHSSAAIVTPLRDTASNPTNFARDAARQMIEVITLSSSSRHLTILVQEMLNGQGDKSEEKKASQRKIDRVAAEKHCAKIVACLIEELVIFEENRDRISQEEAGKRLVSILSTLDVFAEASPSLLLGHYDNLLHYLKADNGVPMASESSIVVQVCRILSHLSQCLSSVNIQQILHGDIAKDLVKIAYKFGMLAAGNAVECLVKLATHQESERHNSLMIALMKLVRTFYSHLLKMKNTSQDLSKLKDKERNNIHRALSVLGFICRHHNGSSQTIINGDVQDFVEVSPSDLNWENLPSSCYIIFKTYLTKRDTSTKCKSLRAIAGIFSSYPRIMLAFEQEGTLCEVMSSDAQPELQLEALQCWREILTTEEQRVESGEAKRQMESKANITTSKKISGDQDGDASLIGACCIQHAPRIFAMTSSIDPKIRLNSLLLIETLLRQGLVNPMEMIPVLFGLQGDLKHPQIRLCAHKLLVEETEKRPDMIRQLLSEGIRHCYDFQNKIYKDNDAITAVIRNKGPNNIVQIECIFGQIYKDSIRNSRSHSIRVIKSLLNRFTSKEPDESPMSRVPLLSFTSEVLAYLPYNHLGDVLFVIHNIATIVSLESNEVLTNMNSFLGPYGLSDKDASAIESDKFHQIVTKARFKKKDKMKFAELCAAANSIVLLIRLSTFLREAYGGVTTNRLVEYHPGEKERITDRGISRIDDTLTFCSKFPNATSSDGKQIDLDVLAKQYIEFCRIYKDHDLYEISHGKEDRDSLAL